MDASSYRLRSGDAAAEAAQELERLASRFSGEGGAAGQQGGDRSLLKLRSELGAASWVELRLESAQDRLQLAMALEKEAREIESAGFHLAALAVYERTLAV